MGVPREICRNIPTKVSQPRCATKIEQECKPVSRKVDRQVCSPTSRQECSTVPRRECADETTQSCSNVPVQECESAPVERCKQVERKLCNDNFLEQARSSGDTEEKDTS